MRPLLWVAKSREKLAVALRALNHVVSANTVGKMLITLGYSRQVNRKTKEGSHHPDRDGQFQHINREVLALQAAGQPVVSVDTKKKEMIGDYQNGGRVAFMSLPSRCTTSSISNSAKSRLTASMTSRQTPVGSVSGLIMTRRPSR